MKVNIITQPLFVNYGGILQNYALQETIRRLGHEPLTVNVAPGAVGKEEWKDSLRALRNLISRWKGDYALPYLNPHTFALKQRELSTPQGEFIKKYINKKDVDAPFSKATEATCAADMWVVGSDQVWRPWCNRFIENEFFDFLDDKTPRMAYAASFGTDQWEISEKRTPRIKELALKFKSISVREESGVRLCKDFLGVDAAHVLDPTMLLKAEDYLALTSESDHPDRRCLSTYILDHSRQKGDIIIDESRKWNLSVEKVGVMYKDRFDSIESWLSTIAHSERVITDSFHGTVFSLIFNRPVKVLDNNVRGNSRLQSLLSLLKLKPDEAGYIVLDEESRKELDAKRDQSLKFLRSNLNG